MQDVIGKIQAESSSITTLTEEAILAIKLKAGLHCFTSWMTLVAIT